MAWRSLLCVVAALLLSPAAAAQQSPPQSLDFLAGEWVLHDPGGAQIGRARVEIQAPGAALFEQRTVGETAAQPIWFVNSEAGGWTQLFLAVNGQVRGFPAQSAAGAWPLVMGAEVTLRDGSPARFRLTMTRASDDETRRLLEMSRDGGAGWTTVFDYTYRRVRQASP